ncbi:CheY-like chemotaxis protein [Azospirillum lipoferum]|uniref:Response regulator n=1 Tax=Azospirillum lipoferum TaxID=193 RepID=A0A5A9GJS9_AZOLI|nr:MULTISPECIES: response regulator [Azospirillum]KAA0594711.1 response regulator [Azospirillum lipoferum]MCP1612980.1 CheY-like chemotaxis protein [Azospirillum lipoferum]MDW5532830.1 response regulator [Azospirillum sp. NL1]
MASVLIIDDDDVARAVLLRTLTMAGHEAVGARDGVEGMERFRDRPADSPLDLVITDIFMPNQEGLATIMELRRGAPSLKIIAISGGGARASLDVLPVAEALGAHRTLRKPFTPTEVMEVVRAVLEE